jgi:hypothetical protein
MTDIKLLALLNEYYEEQITVVCVLMCAMEDFERGREESSWAHLFMWCEAKDRRDKLFIKFKNNYARAVMLKEGYE